MLFMEIVLKPGKYIVAVSGGVDSMVLLHLLNSQLPTPNSQLVVAHFDHGIHKKSAEYLDFVAKKAEEAGLKFVSEQGQLGARASEAQAREARYKFLRKVRDTFKADAILTAHHRDDALETAVINLLRGSGRKGLSSLKSTAEIKRPLLPYTKEEIISYAKKQGIEWREDPTNQDTSYLRNYVRRKIVPRLTPKQKNQFLDLIDSQQDTNKSIEELIAKLLQQAVSTSSKNDLIAKNLQLNRKIFNSLSHSLAKEVMAEFLRSHNIPFGSKLLEKSVVFVKTAKPEKRFVISDRYNLETSGEKVKLNLL